MCTALLPPGVNSIAVSKYININIQGSHHLFLEKRNLREVHHEQKEINVRGS